jgi:hypothetical protein
MTSSAYIAFPTVTVSNFGLVDARGALRIRVRGGLAAFLAQYAGLFAEDAVPVAICSALLVAAAFRLRDDARGLLRSEYILDVERLGLALEYALGSDGVVELLDEKPRPTLERMQRLILDVLRAAGVSGAIDLMLSMSDFVKVSTLCEAHAMADDTLSAEQLALKKTYFASPTEKSLLERSLTMGDLSDGAGYLVRYGWVDSLLGAYVRPADVRRAFLHLSDALLGVALGGLTMEEAQGAGMLDSDMVGECVRVLDEAAPPPELRILHPRPVAARRELRGLLATGPSCVAPLTLSRRCRWPSTTSSRCGWCLRQVAQAQRHPSYGRVSRRWQPS